MRLPSSRFAPAALTVRKHEVAHETRKLKRDLLQIDIRITAEPASEHVRPLFLWVSIHDSLVPRARGEVDEVEVEGPRPQLSRAVHVRTFALLHVGRAIKRSRDRELQRLITLTSALKKIV